MGKFTKYAERINEIASEIRKSALEVEDDFRQAEEGRRQYPHRGNPVTSDYTAKVAQVEADYLKAKAKHDHWRREKPGEVKDRLAAIRQELEEAIDNAFAANPDDLAGNENTLTLLKSGILRPEELDRLLSRALKDENYTLARLITAHAGERANAEAQTGGMNSERARKFRAVANFGPRISGATVLHNFDILSDILNRCVRNVGLWPQWESLTGDIIQNGF